MSGHSKWSTIKHKKGAKDAARGKLFSKLAKDIRVAVQLGGADEEMNFALRLAIEKAKAANMPKDNIERNIKKASGQSKADELVRITYEAYGPGSSMLIIECSTDNTNRSLTEVRTVISSHGGKFASEGSILWQFENVGLIELEAKRSIESARGKQEEQTVDIDELQMEIMGYEGVEDILVEGTELSVIISKEGLQAARDGLMKGGVVLSEAKLAYIPQSYLDLSPDEQTRYDKLLAELENVDDVDNIWSNINV